MIFSNTYEWFGLSQQRAKSQSTIEGLDSGDASSCTVSSVHIIASAVVSCLYRCSTTVDLVHYRSDAISNVHAIAGAIGSMNSYNTIVSCTYCSKTINSMLVIAGIVGDVQDVVLKVIICSMHKISATIKNLVYLRVKHGHVGRDGRARWTILKLFAMMASIVVVPLESVTDEEPGVGEPSVPEGGGVWADAPLETAAFVRLGLY